MDAGELLDLLGNENRRRILRLLARKPCYVTEISEALGVSPKAVIDHLRRLERAGLIESRTDDQRRKYFHIAQNLRLEVTVSPYAFGMKSAYPASPSLDVSSFKYLSVDVHTGGRRAAPNGSGDVSNLSLAPADAEQVGEADPVRDSDSDQAAPDLPEERKVGDGATDVDGPFDDITTLADELADLEELERELSLAQRWAQGRIADVIDRLVESVEAGEDYLDAEVMAAVARGADRTEDVSVEVGVPPPVVEDRLRRLERHGIVSRDGGDWTID